MTDEPFEFKNHSDNRDNTTRFYEAMPLVVKRLLESCLSDRCFDHIDSMPIPSMETIATIIQKARRIIFPGYFTHNLLAPSNIEYCLRQLTGELFKNLSQQIMLSIQHNCLAHGPPCWQCREFGHQKALEFILALPQFWPCLN